jgi:SRSO17 transposase
MQEGGMTTSSTMDADARRRLDEYCTAIGGVLGHKKRRESFALYAYGLLGDGERKSIEPIAARCCPDVERVDAMHQQLHHFIGVSDWDDHAVRLLATRYAIEAMKAQGKEPDAWIFDDTGFPKQGKHSVGVQRQYTGTAGKVTNCQIGVSLSLANGSAHVPIDFELYLPESWANDPVRREEAHIPDEVIFKTKPELALQMLERAAREDLPGKIVLADADYGKDPQFRATVRMHGFDYALGIHSTTNVWCVNRAGKRRGDALMASALAAELGPKSGRRVTWREGTARKLSGRFTFRRVKVAQDDGLDPASRPVEWLMIEWPADADSKPKFYLATLPARMSKAGLVRLLKERWRTERVYQELKTELGLDHFEGRRFRGWHHHVTVALCCHAFITAERLRALPPSAGCSDEHAQDQALPVAA